MTSSFSPIVYDVKGREEQERNRSEALRESIELISKKWHPQILYELGSGFARFNELETDLEDISSKVLSSSLSDLQEKGLVKKSDHGYTLSSKGLEMREALDSIADWGQKFSDGRDPEVLVVEDERPQRQMYVRWLDHYYVEDVDSAEGVYENIASSTDIVLLDRILEDGKGDKIAENLKEKYPGLEIVMITAVDPDIDMLDLEIDDYLMKPVKRKNVLEAVERALERSDETEEERELLSLASKKAVLDKTVIDDLQKYDKLQDRIEELKSGIDNGKDLLSEFDV